MTSGFKIVLPVRFLLAYSAIGGFSPAASAFASYMTETDTNSQGIFSPGTVRILKIEHEDAFGEPVKLKRVGEYAGVYLNSGPDGGILTVSIGERELFSGVQFRNDVSDGLFTFDCFRLDEPDTGLWGKYRIEFFYQRKGEEPPAPQL